VRAGTEGNLRRPHWPKVGCRYGMSRDSVGLVSSQKHAHKPADGGEPSLRRRGDRREILELATLPAPEEGEPWDGPGLLELWEWLEGISGQLERLLSPLEFRSLWAAEGAKTTREAAIKIPATPKACCTLHLRVSGGISRRFFPESCLPSTSL
jgi:hypothetical protein